MCPFGAGLFGISPCPVTADAGLSQPLAGERRRSYTPLCREPPNAARHA
jgi:hypothetical protein